MTTALVARPLGGRAEGFTATAEVTLEIVQGLDAIEASWRALEADAVMTPYARFDWVAAYQGCLSDSERNTRVAVVRSAAGDIVALMPFQVEHRFGLRIAATIGSKHANYNLPVMRPGFAAGLNSDAARRLLLQAGRALEVDMIAISSAPVAWNGWPNPFAEGGRPSASDAWALRLGPDGEEVLARSMSGDARKKMRNKARRLADAGEVRLLRASSETDVGRVLEAYLQQKQRRLDEQGITDPFADPGIRAFLYAASASRLAEGCPPIELYALLVDEQPVAVLGGASDGRRFSGMIVSFQAGPLDKFSPGEMLVTKVVKDLCERGFMWFDLGVGEARYKRSICDEVEALVDVLVPLTLRGRTATLARAALLGAKRRVKASPRAMSLVRRVQKLAARTRG